MEIELWDGVVHRVVLMCCGVIVSGRVSRSFWCCSTLRGYYGWPVVQHAIHLCAPLCDRR